MSDTEGVEEVLDITGTASDNPVPPRPAPLNLAQPNMPAVRPIEDDFTEDDDADETLSERLWGLTEMFPQGVRKFSSTATRYSCQGTKAAYSIARTATFAIATSAAILVLPIMFESERSSMEEQQLQQQRQILLGPNAAAAAGSGPGMGFPGVAPPS